MKFKAFIGVIVFFVGLVFLVTVAILGNEVLLYPATFFFVDSLIFCLVYTGVYCNKVEKEKKETLSKKLREEGFDFEVIYDKNEFVFLLDRKNGKFAINYEGPVYNISDIHGFGMSRSYDKGTSKFYSQKIVIILNIPEGHYPHTRLEMGYDNKYGYTKASFVYDTNESLMSKCVELLIELNKGNKEKFYQKHDFVPREEFWFNGQMFSYDLQSRKFCTFTYLGFEMYEFENYLDYHIEKDEQKISKINWSNAITGAILGGGSGSAYWAKDTEKICENLTLILECDLGFNPVTDNTEFVLIDNQYVSEKSVLYKQVMTFVDNVTRVCKIIKGKIR